MRLAEFSRAAAGDPQDPRRRAAGSARAQAGSAGTECRVPSWGRELGPRGAWPTPQSLRPRGLPKAHPPLGVPLLQGELTSDPASREVFQLEAAHGRGCGAAPARVRVGAHLACAGRGPREGHARADGQILGAPAGPTPSLVSRPLPSG